ncbi:MAG: GntR family transcriptional regulator, partial [Planctomycetota bacterium]|nr:GntR family transcriptional regulator [Planctomycetota bacterium]
AIRETLFRLEQDGLVERRPRAGTFVREIEDEELLEIYDLRMVVEGLICRVAAEKITDEQLDELSDLAELTDSVEEENEERDATDYDFHRRLCEISQLNYAKRVLRITYLHSQCARMNQRIIYWRGFRAQRVHLPDHCAVVEVLRRRDPDAAETIMREHLRSAKSAVIKDMERIRDRMSTIHKRLSE